MTENDQTMTANEEMQVELSEEELGRALEAVLFAAGYPVGYDRLCKVFGRDARDMKRFVKSHARWFNSLSLGIMILVFEESAQICTREDYKDYIRQTLGIRMSGRLSSSNLETLAIIAYNQPVTKAYVEKVRGVDCSYAISSLCDKGLIESKDRLEVPGRPLLYTTTDAFLRVFGIEDLSELPEISVLGDEENGGTKAGEEDLGGIGY